MRGTGAARALEVLTAGALTTVQDLGRPGWAHLGVGRSGAADRPSLRLANRLVGNAEDAACLEVTLGGLAVWARTTLLVAVAGAPCPVVVERGRRSRAEAVGAAGQRILVNGPAKSDAEYAAGARLGATFIIDREEEVGLLPPHARVLVRVNPALAVSTHDHLATGAEGSKFGVTL